MIRIFVVASTPIMRAGLQSLLRAEDIEVTGEAADVKQQLPAQLAGIDLLVLAGNEVLSGVLKGGLDLSGLAVLVLVEDERSAVLELQDKPMAGWAILPPDTGAGRLLAAARAVTQGLVVVSQPTSQSWLNPAPYPVPAALALGQNEETLTSREREVLELLSQGLPNKLIARRLQISEHTVKFHVSSIYSKLDASSRAEAVNRGVRLGLITF